MAEFDPKKLETPRFRAWEARLNRDGEGVLKGQWEAIVARVEQLRSLGMMDEDILEEVSSWELDPIKAMIRQAIEGAQTIMSDNTKCECGEALFTSTTLVPGRTVIECRSCHRSRLEGDDEWITPDDGGVIDRLRTKADITEAEKARSEATEVTDVAMGPDAANN